MNEFADLENRLQAIRPKQPSLELSCKVLNPRLSEKPKFGNHFWLKAAIILIAITVVWREYENYQILETINYKMVTKKNIYQDFKGLYRKTDFANEILLKRKFAYLTK
ncbi:hypothetical protein [Candidatus Uabimicrobium sp. HlEnr_7]|uniref:hypothetical protein n=1 Tax=Candidatus Uabimicrobium helgolandensis TaxID=3095367 RepID=UPI003558F87E